ncbi:MAG: DUF5615 family PIN-like protein [Bifidobacteriaceae bacterium]|nr:DUF5615 family PIN-like protein [Bifidobacteriaceae bacterium]
MSAIRLLLDEHYPPALARLLRETGIDAVAITADRPLLMGAPDSEVLMAAVADGRVVVTEDVTTFPAAVKRVPGHLGIVYCRSRAFPRTRGGLQRLAASLQCLASDPPPGLGSAPLEWWLARV